MSWRAICPLAALAAFAVLAPVTPATAVVEWRPPVQISDPGQDAAEPKVALSANGEAIAVWDRSDGTNGLVQAAVRPAGGSFGTPQTLSDPGQDGFQPQIAIDPNGNSVAVWTRFDGSNLRVQASVRAAGGSFSDPLTLSQQNKDSDSPQVSMDAQGYATAVWVKYDGTGATTHIETAVRPPGGSFGASETISYMGQFAFEPQVAAENDPQEAVAVWSRFDGLNFRTETSQRINGTAPYPTPQSASPASFALVPVFRQCGTGSNPANGAHSPPLTGGSCNPPVTTAGAVAHIGVQGTGSAQFTSVPGNPGTPADEADASIAANLTDVRSGSPLGADYNPNASGPDLTLAVRVRVTDLKNTASSISCGTTSICPGTTTDLDLSVPVNCVATADPSIGATCSVSTTIDTLNPNAITEGRASLMQLFRSRLSDSGANGIRGDGDDRLFAQQGFYVP